MAGGISLHLCQNNSQIGTEDYFIDFIEHFIRHQDQELYQFITKIKDHVTKFINFIHDNNNQNIQKASSLVGIDLSIIENYMNNNELLSILKGVKRVLENKSGNSKESEILGLIYFYVKQQENIEKLSYLSNVQEDLRNQFKSYLNQNYIIETEISLHDPFLHNSNKIEEKALFQDLQLTPREIDVLNLVLKGLNNREIAESLYISDHTVKNHVTKILQKLDVSDRSQAIAKIYQMYYLPRN
ncbi:response regulator transcription factor [Anaerobacillus isosaccharinicus]|uniref:Response regulator transcription factor n=1 Tax=Anaerobacillus isosaccharinicus TaxID=1532552 RepID=A0A7S7LCF8_9BACI